MINKEKSKEILELQSLLKKEQEDVSHMLKTVESAKMEARKQSVLSLEIQSYEVIYFQSKIIKKSKNAFVSPNQLSWKRTFASARLIELLNKSFDLAILYETE